MSLSTRAKLGHGLLSGQYSKPPVKSELIEQVMKEEYKVGLSGLLFALSMSTLDRMCLKSEQVSSYFMFRGADINYNQGCMIG